MFWIRHTDDSDEDDPPLAALSDLYAELSTLDREHGEVSVTNDDIDWCVSAHRDGRVVLVRRDVDEDQHMFPVDRERVIEIWRRLVDGDVAGLLREPWKAGYTSTDG
ncbi:MAG: hypothetical protein JNL79_06670 [Myxococcales bacterium]|nr:hypothetical protein [Myxococcales bacterium]